MNVLSLFDGMSCGQIALNRTNIKYDKYFASEIDKWAIKITQKNYPDTIQLGDVTNWRSWNLPKIDLIMGGSPCQGFSMAGKGLNFDDPRSKLFFEFVDILNFYAPKYFLLENVRMKKEWQNIISEYLGVEPIMIDSALVSAQSRKRLYWTNIPNIVQPKDKGILLKDIIESGDVDRDKSYCIDANYYKGGSLKNHLKKRRRQVFLRQSERRLMVKSVPPLRTQNPSSKYLIQVGEADIKGFDIIKRVYSIEGKSPTLTAMRCGHREPKIADSETTWRKLTPLECERLQTVPEGYTAGVSSTQRYKMLGNGWTVDVIAHILSFMDIK